jgi:hypothetical protein
MGAPVQELTDAELEVLAVGPQAAAEELARREAARAAEAEALEKAKTEAADAAAAALVKYRELRDLVPTAIEALVERVAEADEAHEEYRKARSRCMKLGVEAPSVLPNSSEHFAVVNEKTFVRFRQATIRMSRFV